MSNQPKPKKPADPEAFRRLSVTSYQPPGSSGQLQQGVATIPSGGIAIRRKRSVSLKKVIIIFLLLSFSVFLIISIWNLRNFTNASQKLFGTSNTLGVFQPASLESSTNARVNMLIVGYSIDQPGHGGANLTDSIMILSLDKNGNNGYMLSIPRDLYVDIPGYRTAKINEAYQAGEFAEFRESGYSDGGIGLLEKIITDNFGIQLHYYALVNFAAVRDTVDALGGITVNIESSDERGLYDPNFQPFEGGPLKLENGAHKLDGQTALRLTRARGSTAGSYGFPQSDINRIQNQQKVLAAIKENLSWTLALNPYKNGKLFDAAGNNIKTNLRIYEVIPLYRLLNRVPDEDIESINLRDVDGENLLTGYTTPEGQAALIPAAGLNYYEPIKSAIQNLKQ
ncbi:LCP family protein [soil metagenome]